jgi:hypothetical protein
MARDLDDHLLRVVDRAVQAVSHGVGSPQYLADLRAAGITKVVRALPKYDNQRNKIENLVFVTAKNAMRDVARNYRRPFNTGKWSDDLAEVSTVPADDLQLENADDSAEERLVAIEHAIEWRARWRGALGVIAGEKPSYALGVAALQAKADDGNGAMQEVADRHGVDIAVVRNAVKATRVRFRSDPVICELLADRPAPGVLADLEEAEAATAAAAQEKTVASGAAEGRDRPRPPVARRARRPARPAARRCAPRRRGPGRRPRSTRACARPCNLWPRPRRVPSPPVVRHVRRSASLREGGCGHRVFPRAPVAMPPSWPPSGARAGPGELAPC